MNRFYYLVLVLLVAFASCIEGEIPELPENLLDNGNQFNSGNITYFELTEIETEFFSNDQRNLTIRYNSFYDSFTQIHKDLVTGMKVEGDGDFFEFDADREFFYVTEKFVGQNICYLLYFETEGWGDVGETLLCFDVPK